MYSHLPNTFNLLPVLYGLKSGLGNAAPRERSKTESENKEASDWLKYFFPSVGGELPFGSPSTKKIPHKSIE